MLRVYPKVHAVQVSCDVVEIPERQWLGGVLVRVGRDNTAADGGAAIADGRRHLLEKGYDPSLLEVIEVD